MSDERDPQLIELFAQAARVSDEARFTVRVMEAVGHERANDRRASCLRIALVIAVVVAQAVAVLGDELGAVLRSEGTRIDGTLALQTTMLGVVAFVVLALRRWLGNIPN
jgi:hypothetical protein